MNEGAAKSIREAVAQAKLAYAFNAGSYTYSALSACLDAERHFAAPDWIAEFTAHQEASECHL